MTTDPTAQWTALVLGLMLVFAAANAAGHINRGRNPAAVVVNAFFLLAGATVAGIAGGLLLTGGAGS